MTACGDDAKGADELQKEQGQKFKDELNKMTIEELQQRVKSLDLMIDHKVRPLASSAPCLSTLCRGVNFRGRGLKLCCRAVCRLNL